MMKKNYDFIYFVNILIGFFSLLSSIYLLCMELFLWGSCCFLLFLISYIFSQYMIYKVSDKE